MIGTAVCYLYVNFSNDVQVGINDLGVRWQRIVAEARKPTSFASVAVTAFMVRAKVSYVTLQVARRVRPLHKGRGAGSRRDSGEGFLLSWRTAGRTGLSFSLSFF